MSPVPPVKPEENEFRPHVYDGIREYDKRLPNWWLYTLYITIVFWVGYWGYYEWFRAGPTGAQDVAAEMARIESARLSTAPLDDPSLWKMSRNSEFVAAGKAVYEATSKTPGAEGGGAKPAGKDDVIDAEYEVKDGN